MKDDFKEPGTHMGDDKLRIFAESLSGENAPSMSQSLRHLPSFFVSMFILETLDFLRL